MKAGREAVSQTAGDMAARDIRTHLARIYPLSVIASLAPLIGLLGTVVGMIEAFGLVALYLSLIHILTLPTTPYV